MERLLRFICAKGPFKPLRAWRNGTRMASPAGGASTFTTSAPWSAKIAAAMGPE